MLPLANMCVKCSKGLYYRAETFIPESCLVVNERHKDGNHNVHMFVTHEAKQRHSCRHGLDVYIFICSTASSLWYRIHNICRNQRLLKMPICDLICENLTQWYILKSSVLSSYFIKNLQTVTVAKSII